MTPRSNTRRNNPLVAKYDAAVHHAPVQVEYPRWPLWIRPKLNAAFTGQRPNLAIRIITVRIIDGLYRDRS
jgi:hypothetical protein